MTVCSDGKNRLARADMRRLEDLIVKIHADIGLLYKSRRDVAEYATDKLKTLVVPGNIDTALKTVHEVKGIMVKFPRTGTTNIMILKKEVGQLREHLIKLCDIIKDILDGVQGDNVLLDLKKSLILDGHPDNTYVDEEDEI